MTGASPHRHRPDDRRWRIPLWNGGVPKEPGGDPSSTRGTAAADHRHWDIALQLTWGDIPPPPFPAPGRDYITAQFGELGDELGFSGATSTSQDPTEYEAQIDSDEGDASDDEGSVFSQAYQVTTHPRMKVKSRWTMNVKCKWLIMGTPLCPAFQTMISLISKWIVSRGPTSVICKNY